MSFRHTYVTEFLYKAGVPNELQKVEQALLKHGTARWQGNDNGLGYFHGVIKDSNGHDIKENEEEILKEVLEAGAVIKIVFET